MKLKILDIDFKGVFQFLWQSLKASAAKEENFFIQLLFSRWCLLPWDSIYPKMPFLPFPGREQSLRSPLKVAIICHFRSIVVHIRFFGLKLAKMPFSAEISPLKQHFLHYPIHESDGGRCFISRYFLINFFTLRPLRSLR